MVLVEVVTLLVALFFLVEGSDFFIENIAKIAKIFNVSDFVIGLTVVAVGTSLPELAASVTAAATGETGLVVGNVIGSNIANIALILGIAALFSVLNISRSVFEREGLFLLFITTLFYIMAFNELLTWIHGVIFLGIFVIYLLYIYEYPNLAKLRGKGFLYRYFHFGEIVTKHAIEKVQKSLSYETYLELINGGNGHKLKHVLKPALFSVLGLGVIFFSARHVVESLVSLGQIFSVPSTIIGMTVLAVGTSLPELAVAIAAAKKGKGDLLVGTILGSNIYNLLLILGISALVNPIVIGPLSLFYTIPVLLLVTVLLLWFIRGNWVLRFYEGSLLISTYLLFLVGLTFWIG